MAQGEKGKPRPRSISVRGDRNVVAGGDIAGGSIITGDNSRVESSPEAGAAEEPGATPDPAAVALFDTLRVGFDLEELRTLCFVLGVDFDGLRGEGKAGKARELVALFGRRGELDRLATAVETERGRH